MYCSGTGVKTDYQTGFKWLLLSGGQGDFIAKNLLAEFKPCISQEQLSQAQMLASNFRVKTASSPKSN
jgi:hypothetical protein